MQAATKAKVITGDRVWIGSSWKRKDKIFYDDVLIGTIRLTDNNRPGITHSLVSGGQTKGRAIDWCVQEHLRNYQAMTHSNAIGAINNKSFRGHSIGYALA